MCTCVDLSTSEDEDIEELQLKYPIYSDADLTEDMDSVGVPPPLPSGFQMPALMTASASVIQASVGIMVESIPQVLQTPPRGSRDNPIIIHWTPPAPRKSRRVIRRRDLGPYLAGVSHIHCRRRL